MATATVTTPEVPRSPRGFMWDKLRECRTRDELLDLYSVAKAHGYSEEGQFLTALKERLK